MATALPTLISLLLLPLPMALSATFTLTNNCGYVVWPGALSGGGSLPLPTTGFPLNPGESATVDAPEKWSGRFWGRTLCSVDPAGRFSCVTGDCGSGTVECSGGAAAPPATLAEFTLAGDGGKDFYDVSLVDGYNVAMAVVPEGGGACEATGCVADLNGNCPAELRVVAGGGEAVVACKSACEAFGSPEFCCSGEYGLPSTCRPSSYSQLFKAACPRAYSYAYDDATSTFTCATGSASYRITFCPATASVKSQGAKDDNPEAARAALINETVASQGGSRPSTSHASSMMTRPFFPLLLTLSFIINSLL